MSEENRMLQDSAEIETTRQLIHDFESASGIKIEKTSEQFNCFHLLAKFSPSIKITSAKQVDEETKKEKTIITVASSVDVNRTFEEMVKGRPDLIVVFQGLQEGEQAEKAKITIDSRFSFLEDFSHARGISIGALGEQDIYHLFNILENDPSAKIKRGSNKVIFQSSKKFVCEMMLDMATEERWSIEFQFEPKAKEQSAEEIFAEDLESYLHSPLFMHGNFRLAYDRKKTKVDAIIKKHSADIIKLDSTAKINALYKNGVLYRNGDHENISSFKIKSTVDKVHQIFTSMGKEIEAIMAEEIRKIEEEQNLIEKRKVEANKEDDKKEKPEYEIEQLIKDNKMLMTVSGETFTVSLAQKGNIESIEKHIEIINKNFPLDRLDSPMQIAENLDKTNSVVDLFDTYNREKRDYKRYDRDQNQLRESLMSKGSSANPCFILNIKNEKNEVIGTMSVNVLLPEQYVNNPLLAKENKSQIAGQYVIAISNMSLPNVPRSEKSFKNLARDLVIEKLGIKENDIGAYVVTTNSDQNEIQLNGAGLTKVYIAGGKGTAREITYHQPAIAFGANGRPLKGAKPAPKHLTLGMSGDLSEFEFIDIGTLTDIASRLYSQNIKPTDYFTGLQKIKHIAKGGNEDKFRPDKYSAGQAHENSLKYAKRQFEIFTEQFEDPAKKENYIKLKIFKWVKEAVRLFDRSPGVGINGDIISSTIKNPSNPTSVAWLMEHGDTEKLQREIVPNPVYREKKKRA